MYLAVWQGLQGKIYGEFGTRFPSTTCFRACQATSDKIAAFMQYKVEISAQLPKMGLYLRRQCRVDVVVSQVTYCSLKNQAMVDTDF